MVRGAFTLIEMLITIAIVIILIGLLLAATHSVREAAKRSRTEGIVGLVSSGLAAATQERIALPLVPHPLAGTQGGLAFKRGAIDPLRLDDRYRSWRETWVVPNLTSSDPRAALWSYPGAPTGFDGTSVVPGGGTAVLGAEGVQLVGAALAQNGRRYLANDVFADANVPLLYGAKRGLLSVLGTPHPTYHDHILTPRHDATGEFSNAATQVPQLGTSFDDAAYAALRVNPGAVLPADARIDSEEAVKRALSSVWDQLVKQGAVMLPPEDTSLFFGDRLWSGAGTESGANWRPGMARSGTWRTYRLRTLAIYDAWGVEVLISSTSEGRLRVVSGGRDGCLRLSPGADKIYQTSGFGRRVLAYAEDWPKGSRFGGRTGDDLDGTADNVSTGVETDDYLDRLTPAEAAQWGVSP